mmetsp:Transcript_11604/g.45110  ORF Transcript_11604/g.45110 Transcript_11604/m.45110 type:complete len:201 (+) Transcript_11604:1367-1969(+)
MRLASGRRPPRGPEARAVGRFGCFRRRRCRRRPCAAHARDDLGAEHTAGNVAAGCVRGCGGAEAGRRGPDRRRRLRGGARLVRSLPLRRHERVRLPSAAARPAWRRGGERRPAVAGGPASGRRAAVSPASGLRRPEAGLGRSRIPRPRCRGAGPFGRGGGGDRRGGDAGRPSRGSLGDSGCCGCRLARQSSLRATAWRCT